jgi:hypothetical protein
VLSSEGGSTFQSVDRRAARWCDFTGRLDGGANPDRPDHAGFTFMDHPENHGHPAAWLARSEPYAFLGANVAPRARWTLRPDEPVTLRFGVMIHDGEPDRDRIEAEYQRFRRP